MSSVTKCSSSLKQKRFRLAVNIIINHHFLCHYGYSCGVPSAIHLDLVCTRTRGSDLCLSTIDTQSPVHFTSVTALHRVQCSSFNHALARWKRWLGCGTHAVWTPTTPEHRTVHLLFLYVLLLSLWQQTSLLLLGYHTLRHLIRVHLDVQWVWFSSYWWTGIVVCE